MAKRIKKVSQYLESFSRNPPKKVKPKKGTEGAISTHKARADWFNAREAWPMREAPLDLLLRARAEAAVNIPILSANAAWEEAGPTNVGGRTTSIVVHPDDANRIWVGAAGGGVWSSTDGGLTFTGTEFYPERGTVAGDPRRGWSGPYVGMMSKADPWGGKYLINVRKLHVKHFLDIGSAETLPNIAVMVVSAGPDRALQTPADQAGKDFAVSGDDVVFRIK